MPLLLARLDDPTAVARLHAATQMDIAGYRQHRCVFARTWNEMQALALAGSPQIAVFDPCRGRGLELDECRRFHTKFPSVSLVPYGRFDGVHPREILALAELSVSDVVVRDVDDGIARFRCVLSLALSGSVCGIALAGLEGIIPPHLVPFARELLLRAHRPLTPRCAAQLYHRHPNTLREHLRAAGLPPVNKLIIWSRLFHAAHLLDDRGRSIENVALALEFPSPSALRNQLLRYTGLTPQQIRAAGGLRAVVAAVHVRHSSGSWEARGSSLPPRRQMARESANGVAQSAGAPRGIT